MLSATISPHTMVGRRAPYGIGLLAAVLLVVVGMSDAASARSNGNSNLAATGKNKINPPSPPAGPVPIPYPNNVGKRDAATGQASGKRIHKPINRR